MGVAAVPDPPLNVFRFVPRLFAVAAEESIVVVTSGNQSGGPQIDSREWPILASRYIIFMFSSSGGMKFVILVEDSDSAYSSD